jgi:DNA-binding beta-propeller fold protein YncE
MARDDGQDEIRAAAARWQVLEFDSETLAPAAVYALPARPYALEVAPDGGAAYVLTGGTVAGARASLVHLDLRSGASHTLSEFPGRAAGLAVDPEHAYVPHLDGHAVWVVDRHHGRLIRTIPTGSRPVAVALASGPQAPTDGRR